MDRENCTTVTPVRQFGLACRRFGPVAACLAAFLGACASVQHDGPSPGTEAVTPAQPVVLRDDKMVVLMPAAADEQNQDRQPLALVFAESLHKLRPDLATTPLDSTLSAISAAGLANSYAQLYATYRSTGVFDNHALEQIAHAAGGRYLVQLRLESLNKNDNAVGPLGLIGIKKKETLDMHLVAQIWDGADGQLVWQGASEGRKTKRSLLLARHVDFTDVARPATEQLVKQLPR
jgi:hypothetical protein